MRAWPALVAALLLATGCARTDDSLAMLQVSVNTSKTHDHVDGDIFPEITPGWAKDLVTDDQPKKVDPRWVKRWPVYMGPMHRVKQEVKGHEGMVAEHNAESEVHVQGKHNQGYLCLAFLLGGLGLGSILQMIQERFLQRVPYTCMLFILGWLFAAIHHYRPRDHWTTWPTWFISVDIWEQIDPHLVFYVFLPILIFVEAMRINVKLGARCFSQVMVLACPGVIVGTLLVAVFCKYCFPYNWDWPTALIFGSILSATDPVAVVSLFQQLGVSARLTMIISGESLLNDGTAIVLFELMLKMLLGGQITPASTVGFIVRMVGISILLGVFMAFVGLVLVSWCAESNYHTDAMIQVVVTICLSILCFFLAENECETSGVITVVTAGCVFSYMAWPRFVSKETMRTVWEALEFVGQSLIFLLAGLLFGHNVLSRHHWLQWRDLGWLVVLYLVVTAIRAVMLVFFWPLMNMVGTKLTWQELIVITWSGLRGAVGLILAISLDLEPSISKEIGSHIIFHVGGIAMLTIIINSTSCGPLLRYLDMTKAPEVEDQTTAHLAKVTDRHAAKALDSIMMSDDPRFSGAQMAKVRGLVPPLHPSQASHKPMSVDVPSRLRLYREIFMRTVQRHYWTDLEQGVLPKNSPIARILLYSTDETLSNPKQALGDWDSLVEHIEYNFWPLQRLCSAWPLSYIAFLQQWFPSETTMTMWKVYAALSLMEAHRAAQTQVPAIFGNGSVLTPAIQEQVNRESRQQCEKAMAVLESVSDEMIEHIKSRMLAGKMLQLQIEKVTALSEEGVLHQRGATSLMHQIHLVQREVYSSGYVDKPLTPKERQEKQSGSADPSDNES